MNHILKRPIPLFLAVSLIVNVLTYNGTRIITAALYHYDMTTWFDESIPFMSWTITVYLGCYVFWVINYLLGCRQDVSEAEHFLCAECFAKLICCICFLIIPTTNIRPEIVGTSIFDTAMRWLYSVDAADNLFPSIHCLTSWFCVIAVRKQRCIPAWYKVLSILFALAVCLSTFTTKQHTIADAAAGISLAEGSYWFVKKSGYLKWYRNLLLHLGRRSERRETDDG